MHDGRPLPAAATNRYAASTEAACVGRDINDTNNPTDVPLSNRGRIRAPRRSGASGRVNMQSACFTASPTAWSELPPR
ncbi:hypothetical protein GCM10029964_098560 [Kibdelosporangium lantanae]